MYKRAHETCLIKRRNDTQYTRNQPLITHEMSDDLTIRVSIKLKITNYNKTEAEMHVNRVQNRVNVGLATVNVSLTRLAN